MYVVKNIETMSDVRNVRLISEPVNLFRNYVADIRSMRCDICGREEARWICTTCDNKMVCTDCDQKWHQHPKRRNHKREPLKSQQPELVNGLPPSLSSLGSFTRTSATSKINEGSLVSADMTVGKSPVLHENMTSTADCVTAPTLSTVIEPLMSEEFSATELTGVNLLPKCVTEINQDLSYQSLFGMNNSLTPECKSSGQNARHPTPDCGSSSRHLNSLTNDFQSTLQTLQSVMDEVNSTMNDQGLSGSPGFDDWSLSPGASERTAVSKGPAWSGVSSHSAITAAKKLESRQLVEQNTGEKHRAVDDDRKLARLLAQAKYPPNMNASGSFTQPLSEHRKATLSEPAAASVKAQNTKQTKPSVLHNTEINVQPQKDSISAVQTPVYTPPNTYDLPRTGVLNTPPVENGLSFHSGHNDVQTSNLSQYGDRQTQFMVNRQKSQTSVKQRLTDVPGVVFSRVGNGNDLGVSERHGAESELYHSKFSDVHDEVR